MKPSREIDVTLVSGARTALLRDTLASFSDRLFAGFSVKTLYVNIDPFEGGPAEVAACEAICAEYFPNVVARKPDSPHFTRAVKWLWGQPTAGWFFHLEDDWILSRPVGFAEFRRSVKSRVTQVSLMTREKNWGYRSGFHYEPARLKILGLDFGKGLNRKRPIFGTSPGFVRSDFGRQCAGLMDEGLDPEKQLNSLNPALNAFTAGFRNHFIGARREYVAVDIGRQHRDEQGIVKSIVDGTSVWSERG